MSPQAISARFALSLIGILGVLPDLGSLGPVGLASLLSGPAVGSLLQHTLDAEQVWQWSFPLPS